MQAAWLLLLPLPSAAGDIAVFYTPGTSPAALVEQTQTFRKACPQETFRYVPLPATCRTLKEAKHAALALEAGVTSLPAAVWKSEGRLCTLPLSELTEENIRKAGERPDETEAAAAEQRRFRARQYNLFASMSLRHEPTAEEITADIAECRELMQHPAAGLQDRQLLGLRCLYPLLMQQYTMGYTGAHTPATEAKLLEAIATLEAARDAAPDTPEGRAAHAERERLRTARRQARQYE